MPAAEVQWLVDDLRAELVMTNDAADKPGCAPLASTRLLDNSRPRLASALRAAWHGRAGRRGIPGPGRRRAYGGETPDPDGLIICAPTPSPALQVALEARHQPGRHRPSSPSPNARIPQAGPPSAHSEKPVFIIAAPRSGSTLLFETLACTPGCFPLAAKCIGWSKNPMSHCAWGRRASIATVRPPPTPTGHDYGGHSAGPRWTVLGGDPAAGRRPKARRCWRRRRRTPCAFPS